MESHAGCHALLIEDDFAIRSMITIILNREGFTVDEARTGAEALGKIDADSFHLLVVDLMIPEIDGYKVLEHLRNHRHESLNTVIVMSANPKALKGRFPEHICKFVEKPFDVHQFTAHVRSCAKECR